MPTIAGTCHVAHRSIGRYHEVQWHWTSDASGNVTHLMDVPLEGVPWRLITRPSDGPTDNYDVTLVDALGVDVLLGRGADRDTSVEETAFVYETGFPDVKTWISGLHEFRVRNAGASKSGLVVLLIERTATGADGEPLIPPIAGVIGSAELDDVGLVSDGGGSVPGGIPPSPPSPPAPPSPPTA